MQLIDKNTWRTKLEMVRSTAGMILIKPQGSTAFIPSVTKSHLGYKTFISKNSIITWRTSKIL